MITHAVHEDFPAAARQAAQASRNEVPENLFHRFVEEPAERHELARAEAMHVKTGKFPAHVIEQLKVPLLGQLRVMTALHENLRAAERDGLLDLAVQLAERDHVAVGVLLGAVERAELAVDVADVRVVDIAIDDVSDHVITLPAVSRAPDQLPAAVCERAKFLQRQCIKPAGIRAVNAVAVPDLLQKLIE